jgi:hypothetical protein
VSISPCVFPRCQDENGDPKLTDGTICQACRKHYRRLLGWLLEDYVHVHLTMGHLDSVTGEKITATRTYGHPAEYASDLLARIAGTAFDWEDGLRDYLKHTPARPQKRQPRLMSDAIGYAIAQFDTLCVYPAARDTASEAKELHGLCRSFLGFTGPIVHLDVPCPDCGLRTVTRKVGMDRSDVICCSNCGRSVNETEYGWWVKVVAGTIRHAETGTS